MAKKRTTSDGLQILHQRYYAGRPDRIAQLEEAIVNDEIGRKIFELRIKAGFTHGVTHLVEAPFQANDHELEGILVRVHRLVLASLLPRAWGPE